MILLIGNGQLANPVDVKDYSTIIRINKGIKEGYADVWVNGLVKSDRQKSLVGDSKWGEMWRVDYSSDGKWLEQHPPEWEAHYIPRNIYRALHARYSNNTKPTTGASTLFYILSGLSPLGEVEKLYVTGMDGGVSGSRLEDVDYEKHPSHDVVAERRLLESFKKSGKIEVV